MKKSTLTSTSGAASSSSSSSIGNNNNDDADDDDSSTNDDSNNNNNNKWPPFNPFIRHSTSLQGKILMIMTGLILIPIRIIGAIITLCLGWIWCKIALIGFPSNKKPDAEPYSPIRHVIVFGGLRILSRILLFWYGYIWIQTIYHDKDDTTKKNNKKTTPSNTNKETEETTKQQPKIIVCNHTGFIELLYLAYAYDCSFVSKEENRKLPFIGYICEVMQCIFVTRAADEGGGGGKNNTSQKINERCCDEQDDDSGNDKWPLLVIAPEGTTTNGHVLIHFHTGAFRPGVPVLPIATEMSFNPIWGYDPSFTAVDISLHVLGLMSQPYNRLTVHHLPVYIPSEEERVNATLYATNVRTQIANCLQLPIYGQLQYQDKLLFEISKKKQQLGLQLLKEKANKDGLDMPPPLPIFTKDSFGNDLIIRSPSISNIDNNKKKSN